MNPEGIKEEKTKKTMGKLKAMAGGGEECFELISDASGKEPACLCRRHKSSGLIPGLGRSPGGGHGNPLQYSCMKNPVHRGAWRATDMGSQSRT